MALVTASLPGPTNRVRHPDRYLVGVRGVAVRDGAIVFLSGELDIASRGRVVDVLTGFAGATVVVDITGLDFIDASGLSALVAARKALGARGGNLEVRGASGRVRWLFELTGLEHLLDRR